LKLFVSEEKFSLFGFINLEKLGKDWYKKELPKPTWLTKMDFTEYLSCFYVFEGTTKTLCETDIKTSDERRRFVYIDYAKPDRKNWIEVMSAEDFDQNVAILHKEIVDQDKLVIVYHKEGNSLIKVYKLGSDSAEFIK
jgi:hypothetical protein